jgi:hypothetical protein
MSALDSLHSSVSIPSAMLQSRKRCWMIASVTVPLSPGAEEVVVQHSALRLWSLVESLKEECPLNLGAGWKSLHSPAVLSLEKMPSVIFGYEAGYFQRRSGRSGEGKKSLRRKQIEARYLDRPLRRLIAIRSLQNGQRACSISEVNTFVMGCRWHVTQGQEELWWTVNGLAARSSFVSAKFHVLQRLIYICQSSCLTDSIVRFKYLTLMCCS